MKHKYEGLTFQVIYTEPLNLLVTSNVKLKAKTKVEDWKTDDVDVEFGLDGITTEDTPTP